MPHSSRPAWAIGLWFLVLAVMASVAQASVAINYTLPYTSGQTKTYRVTLAITDPNNTDWVLSTFLSGAVRTVNPTNQGNFTDNWDGLDDNRMPLPPGSYKVKGIYVEAAQWGMDGQYHAMYLDYVAAPGDSWTPAKGQGDKEPHFFGFGFSNVEDVQVADNDRASVLAGYLENNYNPFVADMTAAIGVDQVIAKYDDAGIGGGQTVACDDDYTFAVSHWDQPYLYRANDKTVWGPDSFGWGLLKGYALGSGNYVNSMVAWKRSSDGAHFLYVTLQDANGVGSVKTYNGGTASLLGTSPTQANLNSVTIDRQNPGNRIYALYKVSGNWTVGYMTLSSGVPSGNWTTVFTVPGTISSPTDMDRDSAGNFYIAAESSNAVYKLNSSGTITYTWGGSAQTPGTYDQAKFMNPRKIAIWKDGSTEKLLILEIAGPNRMSEWTTSGTFVRQWVFLHDAAQYGYCADPADPTKLYAIASQSPTGKGLIRYSLNYDTGAWTIDAVWPDICNVTSGQFPGGAVHPRIFTVSGTKYLAFAGGGASDNGSFGYKQYMIYRMSGSNWIPAAGIYSPNGGTNLYWWTDGNGDGLVQSGEYSTNAANLPGQAYWYDRFTDDLSLITSSYNYYHPFGWQSADSFSRATPTGYNGYSNPTYSGTGWAEKIVDTVLRGRQSGTATLFTGANEIDPPCFGTTDVDGSTANGYYVVDSGATITNPYGYGEYGKSSAVIKLSRYVPNGSGGYTMKWRVGRKALAGPPQTGEMYHANHLAGPVSGVVVVADFEGMAYLFDANSGLYIDTLMLDHAYYHTSNGGMYMQDIGAWSRPQLVSHNSKTYLLWNRTALGVYEIKGLTASAIQTVTGLPATVTLTPGTAEDADLYAVMLRNGFGKTHVLKSTPTPSVTLPLNGPLTGWDTSTQPLTFQADANRTVSIRTLNDADNLYLRMAVRTGSAFTPQTLGSDPTNLFTSAAGHTTVSIYLRCDTGQTSLTPDGSGKDVRLVFGVVNDAGTVKAVCLGMYPTWTLGGTPTSKNYTGTSGTVSFAHVGLMSMVTTGYRIDADGMGFVIGAKIPRSTALPISSLANVNTWVDASATFAGTTKVWWANTGKPSGLTTTNDDAANARLYPAAWTQGQFSGGLTAPFSSNLYTWVKADAITGKTEGQAISSWTDSSGNSRNFANGTGAQQPLYGAATVNGWPAVKFDGSNDQLYYVPGTAYSGNAAAFVYGQAVNGNSDVSDRLFSAPSAAGSTDMTYGLGIATNTTSKLYPQIFEHQPGGSRTLATLGLGQYWDTVGGATSNLTYAFNGDISEALIYNTSFNAAQQQKVRDYLRAKYTYPPSTAPAATATVPTDGLQLWFKADAITGVSDGGVVGTWTDSSGNSRNATQSATAYKPTYYTSGLKGKPSVRFDGTDDWMAVSYDIPNSEVSYVAAFRTRSGDTYGTLLTSAEPVDATTCWAFDKAMGVSGGHGYFNVYNVYGTAADTTVTTPAFVNNNDFHIMVTKFGAEGAKVFIDGQLDEMCTNGISTDTWGNGTLLGGGPVGALGYLKADVGDVLVYNRSLTIRELDQLKAYLTGKYNGTSTNLAPTASISSPSNGGGFLTGESIVINSASTDEDGYLTKVEFYQGTTKLGEDTTSPFSYTWTNVSAGTYNLTVKATDNSASVTTSAVTAITVSTTTLPTTGLAVWLDSSQGITLNNGKVERWGMKAHGLAVTPAAEDVVTYGPSYSATGGPDGKPVVSFNAWKKLKLNNVTLLDNLTNVTWFVVGKSTAGPMVDVTSGAADWSSMSSFFRTRNPDDGTGYHVSAGPNDSGSFSDITLGTITATYGMYTGRYAMGTGALSGWKNMNSVQTATGPSISNAGANQQLSIGSIVYWSGQGDGAVCDVSEVIIYNRALSDTEVDTVRNYLNTKYALDGNQRPTCTLTAPTLATAVASGTNTTLTATATDSDGTISNVKFYNGATLLSTDSTSPYSYTWNSVSTGAYSITAVATDNGAKTKTSDAVTLYVLPATNCQYWLDAGSGITLSNGKVSNWASRVGSLTVTPASDDAATYGPTTSSTGGPNSKPVVIFDGTDKLRKNDVTALNSATAGTWVVVGKYNGTGNAGPLFDVNWGPSDWTSTTAMMRLRNPNDGSGYHTNAGVGYSNWGDVAYGSLSDYRMFSSKYTCSTGKVEGIVGFANPMTANGPTMTNTGTHQQVSLGATGIDFSATGTNCNLSEILFYNSALSDSDLFLVRNYLNAKYFGAATGNQAPTTIITAPTVGQSYSSGANVTIDAQASDSDGTVSKVEFYQGTTLLGTDTSSPYSYTWSSVAAGSYSLSVKAYDDDSVVTTSEERSISVSSIPTSGLYVWMDAGTGVTTSGGLVTQWTSQAGSMSMTPAGGNTAYAPTFSATGGANGKPMISFDGTDKLVKNAYTSLDNMTALTWFVVGTTSSGPILDNTHGPADWSSVTFDWRTRNPNDGTGYYVSAGPNYNYAHANFGTATVPALYAGRYTCSTAAINGWKNNGSVVTGTGTTCTNTGIHQQLALGADVYWTANNDGAIGTVSEVLVYTRALSDSEVDQVRSYLGGKYNLWSGNTLPSCSITSPASGASYSSPASITINASASDVDGTISKVEFFQGSTKLGEDTSSPYSYTWTNVSAGSYSLTAKAWDNVDGTTTSTAVGITVNSVPTTGLMLWLDGSQGITLNGSSVSQWASRYGSLVVDPAGGDITYAPTYSATGGPNSKPVLTFSGNSKLRVNYVIALNNKTGLSWFVVGKRNSGSGPLVNITSGPSDWSSITYEARTRFPNDGTGYHVTGGADITYGSGPWSDATLGTPTNYGVMGARWSNNGNITGWLNGNSAVNGTGPSMTNTGVNQQISIGSAVYWNANWDGTPCDICEVLVYDSALSDTDAGSVMSYLRNKYGL